MAKANGRQVAAPDYGTRCPVKQRSWSLNAVRRIHFGPFDTTSILTVVATGRHVFIPEVGATRNRRKQRQSQGINGMLSGPFDLLVEW